MSAILFVCTANICRSPMAEAVMKQRFGRAAGLGPIESAGTRAGPRGEHLDARAAAALQRRDYVPDRRWRSRRVRAQDFERFDLILAMEADNLADLRRLCPAPLQHKLRLLLDDVSGLAGQEVPDPYYGPAAGFDHVLLLIERAVESLAQAQRRGELRA